LQPKQRITKTNNSPLTISIENHSEYDSIEWVSNIMDLAEGPVLELAANDIRMNQAGMIYTITIKVTRGTEFYTEYFEIQVVEP